MLLKVLFSHSFFYKVYSSYPHLCPLSVSYYQHCGLISHYHFANKAFTGQCSYNVLCVYNFHSNIAPTVLTNKFCPICPTSQSYFPVHQWLLCTPRNKVIYQVFHHDSNPKPGSLTEPWKRRNNVLC